MSRRYLILFSAAALAIIVTLQMVNLAIIAQVPAACILKPSGMVSWYTGDGNANDIVASNHGTLQNGATFAAGKVGQAFSFDGVDDFVEVGSGFNLDSMTLEAWVFIDPATNTGEKRVISKDSILLPGTHKAFALKSSSPFFTPGNNGRATFVVLITIGMIDAVSSPSALTAGWHHLAGVRDTSAGRFELYVDGVLVANKVPTVIGAIDSNVNTVIGQVSSTFNGEFFNGLIDEVGIYKRALSPTEIQNIFNADTVGKCKESRAAPISTPTLSPSPSPAPTPKPKF